MSRIRLWTIYWRWYPTLAPSFRWLSWSSVSLRNIVSCYHRNAVALHPLYGVILCSPSLFCELSYILDVKFFSHFSVRYPLKVFRYLSQCSHYSGSKYLLYFTIISLRLPKFAASLCTFCGTSLCISQLLELSTPRSLYL